jgi:hypothetical protein
MISSFPKTAAVAAFLSLVASMLLSSASAYAAPGFTGACCNVFLGCCDAPAELEVGEGGVGGGSCRIDTVGGCNGIADSFKGVGTTCEQFCPVGTTTTTLPTGACCDLHNGCCPAPESLNVRGVPPGDGACRQSLPGECNGINDTYKGDGTACVDFCPIPTTTTLPETTTTTLPVGACCEPLGTCLEVTEQNCVIGSYQGDGTECATVECTQPTTTTVPDTTTTLPETTTTEAPATTTTSTTEEPVVVLCGDANANGEITSTDALIALRTSVGTSQCPLTRCDYNGSSEVTAPDALAILRVSVGQFVAPMCPLV